MIYEPDAAQTRFARWNGSTVEIVEELRTATSRTIPYSPRNSLVVNGIVRFPSKPLQYSCARDLVEEVRAFIHKYVDLEDGFERIAAYYVLLSWIYDAFNELPYLRVRGDPGTGKTRFLTVIGSICYKAMLVSGASSVAPVFRMLDSFRGTLVIDESDFRMSDEKAEFVKILNNGNGRGFPVLRCEPSGSSREFSPRAYSVYGPKIIATRGAFEDRALETRCLTHDTKSVGLRHDIPFNLPNSFPGEALELRNKLLMYRFHELNLPRDLSSRVDRKIEPRLNQVFAPLLCLIEDPEVLSTLREMLGTYNQLNAADRGLDVEGAVLETIRALAAPGRRSPTIREITAAFVSNHGSVHPRTSPRAIGHIVRRKLGIRTA